MTSPAIILVNPQMGENIGAAARAMYNFGLSDLRLVAPRDGWPNESAKAVAVGASHIVESARVFETTKDAVADLQVVYATTARDRRMIKPAFSPRESVEKIHGDAGNAVRSGILFGAERTGLTNEDVTLCHGVINIPTSPEYPSLNIAQSIVILAYEWYVGDALKHTAGDEGRGSTGPNASVLAFDPAPAKQEEIHGLLNHLESELDRVDFWKEWKKKPLMWQNLQNIFTRGALTEQEVRTLRGVIRCLVEGR